MDKCTECEQIKEILRYFPCDKHCEDNQYFTGKSNILRNMCLNNNKCEYFNGLGMFIRSEYPDFTLKQCCDVDERNMASPEAIFVNRIDSFQLLTVEMKSLPQFIENNIKSTKKKNSRENYFWDKIIDKSAMLAYELVVRYLNNKGITQQIDIDNIIKMIWNGIVVSFYPKKGNIDIQNILMNKNEEKERIDEIAKIIYEFSINIFEKIVKSDFKSLELIREYFDDNFNMTIYLSKYKDDNIKFEVHGGVTALSNIMKVNENGLFDQISKYIASCSDKFEKFKGNINILLIDNLYRINYKEIEKAIRKIDIPNAINEIWITEYHYEEEYDDDGDYVGEYIVDKSFQKIY